MYNRSRDLAPLLRSSETATFPESPSIRAKTEWPQPSPDKDWYKALSAFSADCWDAKQAHS